MLHALGMDGGQERLYRSLIEQGPTSLDLAASADQKILTELLAAGLAVREPDGRIAAAAPATALTRRLLDQEELLHRARVEIDVLAAHYRRSATGRLPAEVVALAQGPAAVSQRFAELQAGAESELLATVRADVAAIEADDSPVEEEALARGVHYRVLIDRACLEQPGFYAAVEHAQRQGSVVRVSREVPLRMIIADRRTAMVPMESATTGAEGALLIHPSGLLDAMVLLFEEMWEKGIDLSPAHAGGIGGLDRPDAIDTQLLTLLLAGVSDRAIAAHLSLSLRTMQRRLRALMDLCQVDTRLQLGFEAGRRGWLPRESAT